jgi:hypothetical protein
MPPRHPRDLTLPLPAARVQPQGSQCAAMSALALRTMLDLYRENKLTAAQVVRFDALAPAEQLFDMQKDPYQLVNLGGSAEHRGELVKSSPWEITGTHSESSNGEAACPCAFLSPRATGGGIRRLLGWHRRMGNAKWASRGAAVYHVNSQEGYVTQQVKAHTASSRRMSRVLAALLAALVFAGVPQAREVGAAVAVPGCRERLHLAHLVHASEVKGGVMLVVNSRECLRNCLCRERKYYDSLDLRGEGVWVG